jgi:hypothetical protein
MSRIIVKKCGSESRILKQTVCNKLLKDPGYLSNTTKHLKEAQEVVSNFKVSQKQDYSPSNRERIGELRQQKDRLVLLSQSSEDGQIDTGVSRLPKKRGRSPNKEIG